jgi:DNA-binding transcriptional MerR regulator
MNGYRNYDDNSVNHLSMIQCAKRLGFSLEAILRGLAVQSSAESLDRDKVLQQLDLRLLEVDSLMKELLTQRDEIIIFKQQLQENWEQGKSIQTNKILELNLLTPLPSDK